MAKTGAQTHSEHLGGGLFGGTLYRMAKKLPPTERIVPKLPGKYRTAAAVSSANKKLDLTDEQVIDARRKHEEDGVKCKLLAEEYGVTYDRMKQILNYQTRTFGL